MVVSNTRPEVSAWITQNTVQTDDGVRRLRGDFDPDNKRVDSLDKAQVDAFAALSPTGWMRILGQVDVASRRELLSSVLTPRQLDRLRTDPTAAAEFVSGPQFDVNWGALKLQPRDGLVVPDMELAHAANVVSQRVYGAFPVQVGLQPSSTPQVRHNMIRPGDMPAVRAKSEEPLYPGYAEMLDAGMTLHFLTLNVECEDGKTEESTQVLIAIKDGQAFVTWRGTEPTEMLDLLTDANFPMTEFGGGAGHSGFIEGYQGVREQLRSILGEAGPLNVAMFGHSLGGALAKVAAADVADLRGVQVTDVITTEAPDVWDEDAALDYAIDGMAAKTSQWRNWNDVVAGVPPRGIRAVKGTGGDMDIRLPGYGQLALSFGQNGFSSDGSNLLYLDPKLQLRPGFDPSTPVPGFVTDKEGSENLGGTTRHYQMDFQRHWLRNHGPHGVVNGSFVNRDAEVDPVASAARVITDLVSTQKHDLDRRVFPYEARRAMRVFVGATPDQVEQIISTLAPETAATLLAQLVPFESQPSSKRDYTGVVTSANGNTFDFAPVLASLERRAGGPASSLQTTINEIEYQISPYLAEAAHSVESAITRDGIGVELEISDGKLAARAEPREVDAVFTLLASHADNRAAIIAGMQPDSVLSLWHTATDTQKQTYSTEFAELQAARPRVFAAYELEAIANGAGSTNQVREVVARFINDHDTPAREAIWGLITTRTRRKMTELMNVDNVRDFTTAMPGPEPTRLAIERLMSRGIWSTDGELVPNRHGAYGDIAITDAEAALALSLLARLAPGARDAVLYNTDRAALKSVLAEANKEARSDYKSTVHAIETFLEPPEQVTRS